MKLDSREDTLKVQGYNSERTKERHQKQQNDNIIRIFIRPNTKIIIQMSISQSQVSQAGSKVIKIMEDDHLNLKPDIKEKVKEKLLEDAQFLLEKKRREDEKRQRIRKMENTLEVQRLQKIKMITDKDAKSGEVRQKNKEQLNRKFKQKSEQFRKIVDKIQHHNQEQIRKALSLQKELESQHSKNYSKTLQSPNSRKIMNSTRGESTKAKLDNIDEKIAQIMGKAARAQKQHQEQKKYQIERIRQKSRNIEQAQKRAIQYTMMEQTQKLRNFYQKNEQIQKLVESYKNGNEKKIEQKKKSVKDKFEKCSQNLKNLTYMQEQKYTELENKLNKKYEPKQWKDVRLDKYKQKWEENTKKLDIQKEEKADNILQKHHNITQQNKLYKEKKDKLIQVVKSGN